MTKRLLTLFSIVTLASGAFAQNNDLPKGFAPGEKAMMRSYIQNLQPNARDLTAPPTTSMRTMAEWEEIQTITVAWTSYPDILKQIVAAAKNDVEVLILCRDNATRNDAESYLMSNSGGTPALPDLNNVEFLIEPYNSIWIRDYGANTVYVNDVDSLMLVDWIYNRPRPDDDASPSGVAAHEGIPLYRTINAPNDLVNTGGNFHVDGRGTAFASELILEENEPGNPYDVTAKTETEIDNIKAEYMGIDRYIKVPILQYDAIHHIDMHWRPMDEETLLIGEFPEGISDGPQINANMEYVLSNFNSIWGTPYIVHRIPMPPSPGGSYPGWSFGNGHYRTYANSFFTNNSYVMPTYREEYDTTAMRIIQGLLPGYNIVGIDCDDGNYPLISASGAIHCITKEIGVSDPLYISHQRLRDTDNTIDDYDLSALIKHKSGVASASVFYRTAEAEPYQEMALSLTDPVNDIWSGVIPAQSSGTIVHYYIHAEANSGKTINRPIPAPVAYFPFRVFGVTSTLQNNMKVGFTEVFPNPASAITYIGVNSLSSDDATVSLYNLSGKMVKTIHNGPLQVGINKFFIDASQYPAGMYVIRIQSAHGGSDNQRLVIN